MNLTINKSGYIWVIIILIILNILSLSAFWIARNDINFLLREDAPPAERRELFLAQELNLNMQQKDQFKQERERHFKETKSLLDSIHLLKTDLFNELFQDQIDTQKVNSINQKILKHQAHFEHLKINHFMNLNAFCDPSQKLILNKMFQEMIYSDQRDKHNRKSRKGRKGSQIQRNIQNRQPNN